MEIKQKYLRIFIAFVTFAMVGYAIEKYIFTGPLLYQKILPKPQELRLSYLPRAEKEYTDICLNWLNKQEAATLWWHWSCLIFKFLITLDYNCSETVLAGNKWVCDSKPWNPSPQKCLVYSFGIDNDFSFDDFMINKYDCFVHSFDPSMGKPNFKRNDNNMFYNIGLAGENNDTYRPKRNEYGKGDQVWRMRTLKTIMTDLGHQGNIIDVLKIDIEASEWGVLQSLVLDSDLMSRIKQFVVEWHIFNEMPEREDFPRMFEDLVNLRRFGFYAFISDPFFMIDLNSTHLRSQSEMAYVNMQIGL